MRKIVCSMAAVALVAMVSKVASAAYITDPSNTFPNQYDGNQIWDGTSFLNNWSQVSTTTAALSLSGTTLVHTSANSTDVQVPVGKNGWVQQDSGTSNWETPVGSVPYAVEASIKLTDNDPSLGEATTIWSERGVGRQVVQITASEVRVLGAATALATGLDNTSAFHAYRVNFDPTDLTAAATGSYLILRDGVLLGTVARQAATSGSRLIVGDCCTNLGGVGDPVDTFEIGNVRYSVVPEPATLTLGGLGLLGLTFLRRRG